MYPVTDAVKALYASEQRQFLRITGTDKNGVAINITDANVVLGSFNIDRYSCNGNRLEVGTAIAAEMTVKLDNHDGTYNGIVFEGTELFVEIGIGDPVNWMPCGYFTPDEQPRTANQITIHALDRMVRFDATAPSLVPWTTKSGEIMTTANGEVFYFMADMAFPSTVQGIIKQLCEHCIVPFTQSITNLPNYNLTISEAPKVQQTATFRNYLQWVAGIMGCNAWIDWTGSLRFSWYGANTGYTSTPANRFSSDLHEDDISITGVQYTNIHGETLVMGNADYAVDMTGNYLMAGNVTQVLTTVNNALNGFTYRPFSASIINAPYLWPMDKITFTDKDGNDHTCVLTNVNFGINGAMAIEGKGETAQTNSGTAPSGVTKEQVQFITEATEITKTYIDESLTQEEIFNRLTDNGEIQGLLLYDGKIYLNANYLRSGVIDGELIKAKLLQIIDANSRVIASFDEVIRLGYSSLGHVEIDFNSFEIYGKNSKLYMSVGDVRDSDGTATVNVYFSGDGTSRNFVMPYSYASTTIDSVRIGSTVIDSSDYYTNRTSDGNELCNVILRSSVATPEDGTIVAITATTTDAIYHYDFGIRKTSTTIGPYSVVEGSGNTASSLRSHAEGSGNTASGIDSHAEGRDSSATNDASHVEGVGCTSSSTGSHAEGSGCVASGIASHAEGIDCTASAHYSHAEGWQCTANGSSSHAEGYSCSALYQGAHAEGYGSSASEMAAHAEGYSTTASGRYSHAEGNNTAANHRSQHVFGEYNRRDNSSESAYNRGNYVEIVGNGTSSSQSNARTLDWNGNEWIAGTLTQASDARLKTENGEIPDLSSIRAKRFRWNDNKGEHDDDEHIGYFAQDVEKLAPYLVHEDAMGYKSLDYIALLCAKVDALERRVSQLEEQIKRGEYA